METNSKSACVADAPEMGWDFFQQIERVSQYERSLAHGALSSIFKDEKTIL
jgi:hypothetical protein